MNEVKVVRRTKGYKQVKKTVATLLHWERENTGSALSSPFCASPFRGQRVEAVPERFHPGWSLGSELDPGMTGGPRRVPHESITNVNT